MVDVLDDLGIETTVAHPKEVRAIAKAKIKTNERDPWKLAHLLRTGYIPEVHKRSRENRSSQRVLRQDGVLRGEADSGEEPAAGTFGVAYPDGSGVGRFLAVLVAVEIEDIKRFDEVSKFHAYAGMVPSTHSSGERSWHGKIIKEGNRWLRWAAVEAVWPALRADFDLRCFYDRLRTRKGPRPDVSVCADLTFGLRARIEESFPKLRAEERKKEKKGGAIERTCITSS